VNPDLGVSEPRKLADIPGANAALAFVTNAYRTRLMRAGRTIEHPVAVAGLLAADGRRAEVVIAGLLHDVLEDTETTAGELEDAFGVGIARLVGALTQDPSIKKYRQRKAALRQQIIDAGPDAAVISLADKAAKLNELESRPAERKLNHYREMLNGIERRYGTNRLSGRLRDQLDRWAER
jgi:guanosine-3',5'-bis(diphosphate) 3'-pyrophosphohydrolase